MRYYRILAVAATILALAGCETTKPTAASGGGSKSDSTLGAITTSFKAMTLSDDDIAAMSDSSCAAMDKRSKIAPPGSKYVTRLNRVVKAFPSSINGKTAHYKVYMTKDVNAWAMANGCIRVYSGLMDLMNDDELRGVIGHEIGHVALGHSKSRMQMAYATSAARQAAAASGNSAVSSLSQSQAGDLAVKFINAQYSQSNESAADDYSFDLLTERKLERKGLVTAFQKLAKLSGGKSENSMMSTHPPSAERAAHIQKRLDESKSKSKGKGK